MKISCKDDRQTAGMNRTGIEDFVQTIVRTAVESMIKILNHHPKEDTMCSDATILS